MSETVVEPTDEQLKLITQTLNKESDRGCAILGGGLLAEALERLLRSFFRQDPTDVKRVVAPLFRGYSPLATFSARIKIAYSLAILPRDLRDEIEIVRSLRNDFAHEWGPIDFQDPRCAQRMALIVGREAAAEETGEIVSVSEPAATGHLGPAPTKEQLFTRVLFVMHVIRTITRLNYLGDLAKKGQDIRQIVRVIDEERRWFHK